MKRAISNLFWIPVLLIGLVILLTFIYFLQLDLIDYIHSIDLRMSNNSVSFFSSIATSLAAILAIVFSISLVTIQHAASKYSPSVLEYYKQDKPTIITYLFFIISIVFAIISLSLDLGSKAMIISFILLVFCLFLVLFLFWRLTDIVDPRELIKKIEDKTIKNINQMPKRLKRAIKEVKPKNESEEYLIKSRLYIETQFFSDELLHKENRRYILQLTDIIQKSALWREYETCVAGFGAVANITKEYISIRKKYKAPGDKFLEYTYEKLEAVSKIAFDNKDVSLLQEIIKTFEKIGCTATKIEVISLAGGSNKITGLAGWHIHNIGSKAAEKKLWDVVSQSVRSLGELGISASQKNLRVNVAVISNDIYEIGAISALKKEWFLVHVSNGELARLAIHSISNKLHYFGAIAPIIEDIEKLSIKSIENIGGLKVDVTVSPILGSLSELSMKEMVRAVLRIKNEKYPENKTRWREEYVKKIISKIIDALRIIGINAAKAQKWIVLSDTNDILRDIGLICIVEKFITFEENLEKELNSIVNSLESIYMASKDFSSSIPSKISESLAVLGIHCIENKLEKSISNIISNLLNMAVYTISFDKHGYSAPRIASKIAMIGIFALEKKDNSLAEKCLQSLIEFDTKYEELCSESKPQLHIKELEEEYKTFEDPYDTTSDFYKWFFSKIQNKNLQKFKSLYGEKKKTGIIE